MINIILQKENDKRKKAKEMKRVQVLSDYTSEDEPNLLQLIRDEQGDVHITLSRHHKSERGVRVAASGTKYSAKVREAFYHLIDVIEKEAKQKGD